jgi:hypothetical protein
MIASGGASLLTQLVGGTTSNEGKLNEAKLRLLERRFTSPLGELSNTAVAPQNLVSGFDAVAGPSSTNFARAGSSGVEQQRSLQQGHDGMDIDSDDGEAPSQQIGTNVKRGLNAQHEAQQQREPLSTEVGGAEQLKPAPQFGVISGGSKRRKCLSKSPEEAKGPLPAPYLVDIVAASPGTARESACMAGLRMIPKCIRAHKRQSSC